MCIYKLAIESWQRIGTLTGSGASAPSSNAAWEDNFLNKKRTFVRVLGCLGSVVTFQRVQRIVCALMAEDHEPSIGIVCNRVGLQSFVLSMQGMGKTLVILYLLGQHCYFFKRQIVGKGHKTKANKSNGDYSCQRVHPHVSEAHCGYTSFHNYVIRITYLKLFCEVTLNKPFQLSLLKLYSYKLFQVYLVLVKFRLLQ